MLYNSETLQAPSATPDGNTSPLAVLSGPKLSTYFDIARYDDPIGLKNLNDNIQAKFPRYTTERIEVTGLERVAPKFDSSVFLVLVDGAASTTCTMPGKPQQAELLRSGDLIMLTHGDSAFIQAEHPATFFVLTIAGSGAVLDDRRGITLLHNLPNISGGCNPGGDVPNAALDFRRVVHVPKELNEDGTFPALDIYAVLIHPERSRPHYHPQQSMGGPAGQHELYVFLDPEKLGVELPSGSSGITTWPPFSQKHEAQHMPVSPGDVVSIPANVGHHARGMVMIFAFPGTLGRPNAVGIGKLPEVAPPTVADILA